MNHGFETSETHCLFDFVLLIIMQKYSAVLTTLFHIMFFSKFNMLACEVRCNHSIKLLETTAENNVSRCCINRTQMILLNLIMKSHKRSVAVLHKGYSHSVSVESWLRLATEPSYRVLWCFITCTAGSKITDDLWTCLFCIFIIEYKYNLCKTLI